MSAKEMRQIMEALETFKTALVENAVETKEEVEETKMPAGVIRARERYEGLTPKDFHERMDKLFQDKGLESAEEKEDFLKKMAWRHGYGKMSPHYWEKYNRGLMEANFGVTIEMEDLLPENWDDEEEPNDEEHFDWQQEMESGIVIHDNTRGGYDLSAESKYLGNYPDFDDALQAAHNWKEKNQYWPNMFFVNDHGNVTHINDKGEEIDSIV